MISKKSFRKETVALLLILLLGGLVRIIFLGSIPNGYHQDEAFVVLNALNMVNSGQDSIGNFLPVYMSSWGDGQSNMYIWLLMPLLAVTKMEASLFVVRLPQFIVSVLSVLAIYGVARRLFNETAGILAALLLAVCPWHIMMSRWGLDANIAPGFLLFALFFFTKSIDNKRYLPVSAFFYGLTLYCYAVSWLVVPVIVLSEVLYLCLRKRQRIDKYFWISGIILFVMALPLILFLLVNEGLIGEIHLPFLTIPQTSRFRGGELTLSFKGIIYNLGQLARLLLHADTGAVGTVIHPFGLFYRYGVALAIAGTVFLVVNLIVKTVKKENADGEVILFIQLFAGVLLGAFFLPRFQQTNLLFIPIVILEAYAVNTIRGFLKGINSKAVKWIEAAFLLFVSIMFALFCKAYFFDYPECADAYYCAGVEPCFEYALDYCEQNGINKITVEKAAQWPRALLFTDTLVEEYQSGVVYDEYPAPWSFKKANGLIVQTRIDYDDIRDDCVYICYYTDYDVFSERFDMKAFYDWYVATPKNNH